MQRFSHPVLARLLLLGLAAALLAPVVVGATLLDETKRRRALTRPLADLPALADTLRDPSGTLAQATDYLTDRTGGLVSAGRLLARTRYELLGDPGSPVIGRSGDLVFLLHHNVAEPREMRAVFHACRRLKPGDRWADRLNGRIGDVVDKLAAPGRRFGLLAVPSKPVLYADRLPPKVPAPQRQRCVATRDTPLWAEAVRAKLAARGVPFRYPLARFSEMRDIANFYPPENFHTDGAAAHIAAFSLLEALEPERFSAGAFGYERTDARADMANLLPFKRRIRVLEPAYGAARPRRDKRGEADMLERYATLRQILMFRGGEGPRAGRRALIIGNSFGKWVSRHLAVGFDQTLFINTNGIKFAGPRQIFEEIVPDYAPDTVLFVYHEAGFKHDQGAWLRMHRSAAGEAG